MRSEVVVSFLFVAGILIFFLSVFFAFDKQLTGLWKL